MAAAASALPGRFSARGRTLWPRIESRLRIGDLRVTLTSKPRDVALHAYAAAPMSSAAFSLDDRGLMIYALFPPGAAKEMPEVMTSALRRFGRRLFASA